MDLYMENYKINSSFGKISEESNVKKTRHLFTS